jgi:hypothetical protein
VRCAKAAGVKPMARKCRPPSRLSARVAARVSNIAPWPRDVGGLVSTIRAPFPCGEPNSPFDADLMAHFAFRIDRWADDGESIVEHVAGAEDFQVAMAIYHAAPSAGPKRQ